MGTEPAPSPPASCQSPPDLHGLPGREEGLCQKSEGLKGERKEGVLPQGLGTPRCLGAPMGAHGSHGIGGPHEASGLPQGLTWRVGTPRCLGAPTGAQGSHGGWGAPRCLRAPTGAHMGVGDPTMPRGSHRGSGVTWGLGGPTMPRGSHGGLSAVGIRRWTAPLSGAWPGRAWLGAACPGLLLRLPRPVPSRLPAALANGARCCFGENTFWSLLSEPSQPTPTVEKMCQHKREIPS